MSRRLFTDEQIALLKQNPYVYAVSAARLSLTVTFKEIFYAAYLKGDSPSQILESHGFDLSIIGKRRVWNISQHIREEYARFGCFSQGYTERRNSITNPPKKPLSMNEQLKQLQGELTYIKQEMEFLKKISMLRTSRK